MSQIQTPPFLKWPGGKRWLASAVATALRDLDFHRYFEPFLGGGALFFALRPTRATISDINAELINTYRQVKKSPDALVAEIKQMSIDEANYQRLRQARPETPMGSAIRFLYLNRTAFAGMYRVNRNGEFNVPYGGGERTPEAYWRDRLIERASMALVKAKIVTGDFEKVLASAQSDDLVYCDPTYTTTHNNNGFVRYNERNFAWSDQIRLAECCARMAKRGTRVLVSNACHVDVERLFLNARHCRITRLSRLCPDPAKRGASIESLFGYNFTLREWRRVTGAFREE